MKLRTFKEKMLTAIISAVISISMALMIDHFVPAVDPTRTIMTTIRAILTVLLSVLALTGSLMIAPAIKRMVISFLNTGWYPANDPPTTPTLCLCVTGMDEYGIFKYEPGVGFDTSEIIIWWRPIEKIPHKSIKKRKTTK